MKKVLSTLCIGTVAAAIVLGTAGCGGGVRASSFASPQATITASGDIASARSISEDLFGVFLEDINYTSQAMDDNLLANGSFEGGGSYGVRACWETNADVTEATEGGITPSAKYLTLKFSKPSNYLLNNGYDFAPIALQKGTEYTFAAFIRADDYAGEIKVSVVDGDLNAYGGGTLQVEKSAQWVKYVVTFKATETKEGLQFEMDFGNGTLSIDGVELTTSDATLGVKNYIYNAIADLSPKFVRFPGGCIIEGTDMDVVYDWKNSVGAIAGDAGDDVPTLTYTEIVNGKSAQKTTRGEWAARPTNGDLWSGSQFYRLEYGVGFYEYFLMCEKLGAKPIPIVNCGLKCMSRTGGRAEALEGRHGNGKADYIQDALDLIAFANGSTTSSDANEKYWAQVRADMGHPEPFGLEYIGVGNEQYFEKYYEYYESFLEAFAEKGGIYAAVTPIVGCGTQFHDAQRSNSEGMVVPYMKKYREAGKIGALSEYGMVDHHYYLNYYDFFHFAGKDMIYDSYSRDASTKYEVFVGEYSANEPNTRYIRAGGEFDPAGAAGLSMPAPMNSWVTALSEAAYMTGLERNGDVVHLAAYAPMFGVSDGNFKDDAANQWDVDMMYFTSTKLLLTPNYYVQQIFAPNTGTKLIASALEYSGVSDTCKLASASGNEQIERVYSVISYDEATKEIIVKIVNAGDLALDINVALGAFAPKGTANVTMLQCDDLFAVNTFAATPVAPQESKLTGVGQTFGYTAPKFSASILRIPTK